MVKISSADNNFTISNPGIRKPKGIGVSPYPFRSLIRYIANAIFNGRFSYINPDRSKMKLLSKEGHIKKGGTSEPTSSLKVVFLGDIMVSRSGKPPKLNKDLKNVLQTADIIVANVESPVVNSEKVIKRGRSLNFEMPNSYLSRIYSCNREAKWVFSIANNHACDTSRKNKRDVSGVKTTITSIRTAIPEAEIIGAEIDEAKSVLSLQVEDGPKIGFVGWTEVMNHDKEHYKKKIIRETDITDTVAADIKESHDMLFGFAHGNEEQSYYPLKKTRDRWRRLIDKKKFDVIVGHGPHVLQPSEKVGKKGLLFNSIGNFCSPVGKSQTKIGCVPEITIHHKNGQISSSDFKIHILQQKGEAITVIKDLNAKSQNYPRIIRRLKKIWRTLFTDKPRVNTD